mmetsp:Transcript_4900/g.11694  ORF Transcript_4900/g.11694 Transcript_4900/m.11694 type:complete len:221 (-) Transcript_4900:446-1108(-)
MGTTIILEQKIFPANFAAKEILNVVANSVANFSRSIEHITATRYIGNVPFYCSNCCGMKELPQPTGVSHCWITARTRMAPGLSRWRILVHDSQEVLFRIQDRCHVVENLGNHDLEGPGGRERIFQELDPIPKGFFCFFVGQISAHKNTVLHCKPKGKIDIAVNVVFRFLNPKCVAGFGDRCHGLVRDAVSVLLPFHLCEDGRSIDSSFFVKQLQNLERVE